MLSNAAAYWCLFFANSVVAFEPFFYFLSQDWLSIILLALKTFDCYLINVYSVNMTKQKSLEIKIKNCETSGRSPIKHLGNAKFLSYF